MLTVTTLVLHSYVYNVFIVCMFLYTKICYSIIVIENIQSYSLLPVIEIDIANVILTNK